MLKQLGLKHITFHDLRHTHATLLLSQKINPKIVQERLGHSTITLTLDTYSHLVPDIQKEAVKALIIINPFFHTCIYNISFIIRRILFPIII
ncbi:MAG: tyrosine-type recombinase/integrase [Veillonella sp.]|uniref:tyrosine-type recombinase/integrase n=1 Tax=Veillonella sp. TaxID=1926307 RepID=UPI002914CCF2|nr:tyrosine-type recombinase/integrase [Veillonella sp.]MDU7910921.1 tyrosine-type recombinase/integrase [Veillonella parvula]MDU7928687.1 tyrosine-type recombinase/integrase [Veillonella sp.]MDU8007461.1 tyrosine-type recombinase/integrase [Veillonella sp.]